MRPQQREVCADDAGECRVLALMRRTNAASFGPFPGPYRTFVWRPTISEFDPDVWAGRALQEGFVGLAASGLASMYPAFDWSVLGCGPSWKSARLRSH
jgi:hypothetical protein